jgi:hypothetical protein
MSDTCIHVLKAAQNWHIWGRYATIRYLQKRGVDERLWYLSRRLEACKGLPLDGRFVI